MTAEADGRLEAASRRLERAVVLLEQRLERQLAEAGADAGGLIDQDRSQLAGQLDEARGRQRELEEAGHRAASALAEAIAEVEAGLSEAEG